MGRQIAIAATTADEEFLLAYLRESADIQLFLPCAATIEGLWVDGFDRYGPYHTQYFIWNRAYKWESVYGHVNPDVAGHGGWPFVSNHLQGPVIEFDRTNMGRFLTADISTVQYGRIYWAQHKRQTGFSRWYDAIVRWVRRNGTNLSPSSSVGVYCLPDAYRLWQSRVQP